MSQLPPRLTFAAGVKLAAFVAVPFAVFRSAGVQEVPLDTSTANNEVNVRVLQGRVEAPVSSPTPARI